MKKDAGQVFQFPSPETKRAEWLEPFCTNDFWDSLGRPALFMIS